MQTYFCIFKGKISKINECVGVELVLTQCPQYTHRQWLIKRRVSRESGLGIFSSVLPFFALVTGENVIFK